MRGRAAHGDPGERRQIVIGKGEAESDAAADGEQELARNEANSISVFNYGLKPIVRGRAWRFRRRPVGVGTNLHAKEIIGRRGEHKGGEFFLWMASAMASASRCGFTAAHLQDDGFLVIAGGWKRAGCLRGCSDGLGGCRRRCYSFDLVATADGGRSFVDGAWRGRGDRLWLAQAWTRRVSSASY